MKPGQENIYYLSSGDLQAAKSSPQLEAFKAKGIEVLFMTDTIDEFWLPIQADFGGKKFKSVTRGAAELSKVTSDKKEANATSNGSIGSQQNADLTEKLLLRLKDILSGEVKDVCLSERLVDSPVCLVAPENDVDIHMQHLLKKSQDYEKRHQHILEINGNHPVILKMKGMVANPASLENISRAERDGAAELLKDTAFLLLDQAKIIEGEPLKNPSEFVRRMSLAIEKGLLAG